MYLPLEHSEDLEHQKLAVAKFASLEAEAKSTPEFQMYAEVLSGAKKYAEVHMEIIEKFGRFPHRNAILGRGSTPAEIDYLEGGGETFGTQRNKVENSN